MDYRHSFPGRRWKSAIRDAYARLSSDDENASLPCVSSATAEDMPDASFAGQREAFLNVPGLRCGTGGSEGTYLLLWCLTISAISYRVHRGHDHRGVALTLACGGWFAPISPRQGDVLYRYRIRHDGGLLSPRHGTG